MNQTLVFLSKGAGFGELALMSVTSRMSTCRAAELCTLGTLSRNDFSTILKKAQKRKIVERIRLFQNFPLLTDLSNLKLQKIIYLLEEINLIKGATVFSQG